MSIYDIIHKKSTKFKKNHKKVKKKVNFQYKNCPHFHPLDIFFLDIFFISHSTKNLFRSKFALKNRSSILNVSTTSWANSLFYYPHMFTVNPPQFFRSILFHEKLGSKNLKFNFSSFFSAIFIPLNNLFGIIELHISTFLEYCTFNDVFLHSRLVNFLFYCHLLQSLNSISSSREERLSSRYFFAKAMNYLSSSVDDERANLFNSNAKLMMSWLKSSSWMNFLIL